MFRKGIVIFSSIAAIILFSMIGCDQTPTNPVDTSQSIKADVFINDTLQDVVYQGIASKMRIIVNIPKHVKEYKVVFGDSVQRDTVIKCKYPTSELPDTQYVMCNYSIKGLKTVNIQINFYNGTFKYSSKAVMVMESVSPKITVLSKDTAVEVGKTLSLSVIAAAAPLPSYQWYKDGIIIPGAILPNYLKSSVVAADSGIYYVVVSNGIKPDTVSTKIAVAVYSAPMAHWSFDSIDINGMIEDISLNDYNAVCTGKGFTTAAGVKGKALSLTGRAFEIVVANSKDKFIAPVYTVETWIYSNVEPKKYTGDDYNLMILDFQSLSTSVRNGFGVHVGFDGNAIGAQSNSDGSGWNGVKSDTLISAGRWYHIALIVNNSSLNLYINGKLNKSVAYSGMYVSPGVNARIGCQTLSTGVIRGYMDGILDEMKYYNCALPASVILDHYNNKQ